VNPLRGIFLKVLSVVLFTFMAARRERRPGIARAAARKVMTPQG